MFGAVQENINKFVVLWLYKGIKTKQLLTAKLKKNLGNS